MRSRALVLLVTLGACGSSDTTPPTIESVTPADGATAVTSATAITAVFSEAMDPTTLTQGTFTLLGPGVAVTGEITLSDDGETATFAPVEPPMLAAGMAYIATVSRGAEDLAGNPLAAKMTWSFTMAATP